MSNEQHVENLMKSTMENLKDMIDVNTVIGKAIETKDGTYIVPVSRLSFGFASGGSEFSNEKQNLSSTVFPFGGGSGAGVSVKPVAFLVVKPDGVRMLPVDQDTTYDRIVDTVPQILDIIKSLVKDMCKKNKNDNNGNTTNVDSNVKHDTNECYCDDSSNI
ncbi:MULTISPECIES: GerW family sporulation protein [Clostridium]|jgi:sporulation protein YtfJ|uniref:Sporulation protein YtfJ n=1 Tax=Clostridium saccharoperbutylacetonicum N1-4(HMT) TaxID=931276 RepID=M1MYW8_9CLOT|nr:MULTISPECIES: GerW family sporulation protein [Clostridium]AGF56597.1 sporulation protein YtfJ [Clostridium saccharoperbutylacetonicum N1-4(HMT)]AQR95271.1 putative spore protein YtfJ [Clostridium saccharoperbutylacetonicum]NRT62652.1 sporulation protein YtfJ [Clostridium saccharoperbutylacetonicum]NSB26000.1 sporulation protein YtfJ [Clostridium saccharoperbutylacetonicum]NSB31126.1 sporulation protein YtfJ [Clostridium saccharoperbutylacetonicum]